jgi:hypothetical protein
LLSDEKVAANFNIDCKPLKYEDLKPVLNSEGIFNQYAVLSDKFSNR